MGGTLDANGYQEWRKEDAMLDYLLGRDGVYWAHFGGGFDHKWLLDGAIARNLQARVSIAGSRIVFAQVAKLKLADSYALCPIPLRDFAKFGQYEKRETGFTCTCAANCGGYCYVNDAWSEREKRPRKWRQTLDKMSEYQRYDCLALHSALEGLETFAAKYDIDTGYTIGSSAWRNAWRKCNIEACTLESTDYNLARKGYYGGRVQLFRPGQSKDIYCYDVNSMYPWALATNPLPLGPPKRRVGTGKIQSQGIYEITIRVPEMHIPPLPVRHKGRAHYPTGIVRGVFPLPEIRRAETAGCMVIRLHDSLTWNDSQVIFSDWINNLFDIRAKAFGKDTPQGKWLKLYMNSLTGKFGMRPETTVYVLGTDENIKVCSGCTEIPCDCGGYTPLSKNIWTKTGWKMHDCAHVEWAAYLTSNSRVRLYDALSKANTDAVYCDTDSVFSTSALTLPVSSDLGDWSLDVGSNYVGIAPKIYSYDRGEKTIRKAKGVALGDRLPTDGEWYRRESISGFRSGAVKGKLFSLADVARTIHKRSGDRIETSKGTTRAPTIDEVYNGVKF